MSDQTQTTEEFIPSEDTETVGGGRSSWRFANGKMVQGPEIVKKAKTEDGQEIDVKTGNYEHERTKLIGLLRRLWRYTGTNKYGKVDQLEADIETRDSGIVRLKANLLDPDGNPKIGISAVHYAWVLNQYKKNEPICIETVKGEPVTLKNGSKGGCPTYVNARKLKDDKFYPHMRPKRDKNAPKVSLEDQWADEFAALQVHSAWEPREIPVDEETHFGQLCKECGEKGWPNPNQATPEWLKMLAAALGHDVRSSLAEYSEDEWGAVRQAIKDAKAVPPLLQEAAAKLGLTPPAAPVINAGAFGG